MSVPASVMFVYCIKTAKHILKLFTYSFYPHHSIFFRTKYYGENSYMFPLNAGIECKWGMKKIFDQYLSLIVTSETIQDRAIVTTERQ